MEFPNSRRRYLQAISVGAAIGLAGPIALSFTTTGDRNGSSDAVPQPDVVDLQTVTDGLGAPTAVAFAPAADRRYIAELGGRIHVHEPDGRLDEPFVDLTDAIEPSDESGDEQGLLGMALHPDFAETRRLFLRYSAPRRPEMRSDYSHRFVVSEFEATADGRRVDRESERRVLEIPQPRPLHNAGDLAFGPDGYLYVAVGDSGRRRYAQDVIDTLLAGILRIDVDEWSAEHAYAIPESNPLVDLDGLDEYYAWGFRNPWRISFDGRDFFVADVGQSSYEEVNLVERGGNYGWDVKEGTHCFKAEDCPDEVPADGPPGKPSGDDAQIATTEGDRRSEPLIDPIIEYPHPDDGGVEGPSGVAVIGGNVYRGSTVAPLDGAYVFGDFLARGRLFAAKPPADDSGLWDTTVVDIDEGSENLQRLLAFGRDDDGEMYALGTGEAGGGLFRVAPAS